MRTRTTLGALAVACALGAAGVRSTLACCMVPKTYEGSIGQSMQEALIFHAGDREDLVLRIHYEIKGAKGLPAQFAWVVTLPTEPDHYALADAEVFKAAWELVDAKIPKPKSRGDSKGLDNQSNGASWGVELGKRVKVGDYDIQPVRAKGKDALDGLNGWLEKNGFPTEDRDHMRYFVENGFTFLCIRIVKEKDAAAVESKGGLSPLHMSFKSEKVYYPLRFSSRQGVFDVMLHVFTDEKLDAEKCKPYLERIRADDDSTFDVVVEKKEAKGKLAELFSKVKAGDGRETWHARRITGQAFNQGPTAISTWKEDFFLPTKS